ncbi:ATP-dependent DNA helicase RecQ [Anaerohalosphaera lusitana]|uniref:DNA helicase RecQ n=1 Tax=Anaerohalosphaera lusitana TaxID=1936003 RepID=A0A1U9NH39_9BACT|nr:DNA helicase RecQ [Anaerohalosphaera lusitana]AQT67087.1 ATP-dependent DNA helicase RecQ [Anaerohalosphaera lusitana]
MIEQATEALKKYWGYTTFRPLQTDAVTAALDHRDSLVVLPTGGGKSLCYQVPAVTLPGMAVVVSPLISLMKDQVDALQQCGIPAARLDSSMTPPHRQAVTSCITAGKVKLLYISPERLLTDPSIEMLKSTKLSLIAIDEAHCVSMWGHDFRPEYRQLDRLKEIFPDVAVHAYTATATERVRRDIVDQLNLTDPEILVGSFDRPNLIYSIAPLNDRLAQVRKVIDAHPSDPGIVYCIRRKDVDTLTAELTAAGYKALPYHAGLADHIRKFNQEAFIYDRVNIIVATVAFGMGIDKSNVRYVIHTGMPKSLENYQQESGRAGRDGLDAHCALFYADKDYHTWKFLLRDLEPEPKRAAMDKLSQAYDFVHSFRCRHKSLSAYFGQTLEKSSCAACDMCLGTIETLPESLITAQKIISCIARLEQKYPADYTARVLIGAKDKDITANDHHELTTFALLSDRTRGIVRDWIEQLANQGHIKKTGPYRNLTLTQSAGQILKGDLTPRLLKPVRQSRSTVKQVSAVEEKAWQGVDKDLFEQLREIRRELSDKKRVPAFVVLSDATLRLLAAKRPTEYRTLIQIKGIGQKKAKTYGPTFTEAIQSYCQQNNVETNLP